VFQSRCNSLGALEFREILLPLAARRLPLVRCAVLLHATRVKSSNIRSVAESVDGSLRTIPEVNISSNRANSSAENCMSEVRQRRVIDLRFSSPGELLSSIRNVHFKTLLVFLVVANSFVSSCPFDKKCWFRSLSPARFDPVPPLDSFQWHGVWSTGGL
jgi:hypothetical protein